MSEFSVEKNNEAYESPPEFEMLEEAVGAQIEIEAAGPLSVISAPKDDEIPLDSITYRPETPGSEEGGSSSVETSLQIPKRQPVTHTQTVTTSTVPLTENQAEPSYGIEPPAKERSKEPPKAGPVLQSKASVGKHVEPTKVRREEAGLVVVQRADDEIKQEVIGDRLEERAKEEQIEESSEVAPPATPERIPRKSEVILADNPEKMYDLFGHAFAESRVEPPKPEKVVYSNEPPLGTAVLEEVAQTQKTRPDADVFDAPSVVTELDKVRETLDELSKAEKVLSYSDGAGRVLRENDWPLDMLVDVAEQGKPEWTMGERLAARDDAGEPVVSNERLLSILQWRAKHLQSEAESFKTVLPERLASVGRGILRGVNEGWLPPEALQKLQRFKQETWIHFDDGINLTPFGYRAVYWGKIDDRISLQDSDEEIFVHETLHACAQDDAFSMLFHNEDVSSSLREATVTLLSQVVLGARDPFNTKPRGYEQLYLGPMILMDRLCRCGFEPIDPRYFADVLFESHSDAAGRGEKAAVRRLRDKVLGNFPESIIDMLNKPGRRSRADIAKMARSVSSGHRVRSAYDSDFVFTSELTRDVL